MAVTLYHAHPWQVTVEEAIAIQNELAVLVRATPLPAPPSTVAGVDMSVRGDQVQAAVVVLALPGLAPVDQAIWQGEVQFPYVPGLLSFREAPAVIEALGQLRV
ncbi:MAG TPA: endonuclease V, partial [Caldilineaceae bacterium]|nr:endonuclease V [Caldilineaceae bacterium]